MPLSYTFERATASLRTASTSALCWISTDAALGRAAGARTRKLLLNSGSGKLAVRLGMTMPVLAYTAAATSAQPHWQKLGTNAQELSLDFTLPTGQSFRWKLSGPHEYTGVVGERVVTIRQRKDGDVEYCTAARGRNAHPADDHAALADYFNLSTHLSSLSKGWAVDARYKAVHPYFPGARVLRQDPVECLFQFVCSSNNHISRIHGMVDRLCTAYGTHLQWTNAPPCLVQPNQSTTENEQALYFAFPTLEQLQRATEEELRAAGFGYRAKFITGSVAALNAKPGGGHAWLRSLRDVPYAEASAALCTLPGVGPKVAACVCLFSLDKHAAIPVDTHVWQLATRYYTPSLKGKTLTPKVMLAVEQAFEAAFGPYCGWAHNTLFISELASQRHRLPPHLGGTLQPPAEPSDLALATSDGADSAHDRQAAADSALWVHTAADTVHNDHVAPGLAHSVPPRTDPPTPMAKGAASVAAASGSAGVGAHPRVKGAGDEPQDVKAGNVNLVTDSATVDSLRAGAVVGSHTDAAASKAQRKVRKCATAAPNSLDKSRALKPVRRTRKSRSVAE